MASQLSAKLSLDVAGYEKGLNDAKQSTEQYKTQLGDLSKKFPSMRKELAQTKKAVFDMEVAWRSMSDAQKKSFEGQELQRQLQTLKERGAELKDAVMDVNQEMKNMASDTRQLDAVKQGFDVLGNSISLAANAYAAFTGDSEDAKRALTLFAGVQSTVNTLTALQNALQKQSSLMLAITNKQQKLKTAATELDTAAQGKNIAATKGATTAQWAMNAAADANPYVLLASAIVALVGAYAMWGDQIQKVIGLKEDENDITGDISKKYEENTGEVAKNIIKIRDLQDEYSKLTSDKQKEQWIKDNKDAFHELGVEVENVTDAENLLVNNTDAFIQSLTLRAKASAAAAVAQEAYEEALKKQMAAENEMKDPSTWTKAQAVLNMGTDFDYEASLHREKIKATRELQKEQHEAERKAEQAIETTRTLTEEAKQLQKNIGVKEYNKDSSSSSKSAKSSGGKSGSKTEKWSPIDMSSIKAPEIDIHFGYNQSELDKKIKKLKDQLAGIPITLDTEIDRAKLQKEIDKLEGIKSSKSLSDTINDDFNKSMISAQNDLNEAQKRIDDEEKERLKAKADEQMQIYDAIGQSARGVGSIMSSISQLAEDESFNTAGIIMEAVANIALSFAKAMKDHKSFSVWDWIAVGIAGTAQMLSMIATIKSATKGYANGGVIEGPFHTGDRMLARVNSGEMILNNRQQRNLFDAIDNGKLQGSNNSFAVESFKVRGSDLYLTMKNYEKTTGKKL